MLLFIHTDEWFHAHFVEGRTSEQQQEVFEEFFFPYYSMWTSMVYVVDEGFVELDIEDAQLQKARAKIDMSLLRRFRNGTFHYQPRFRSPKHDDLIMSKGSARTLYERQGVLVRRMGRFLRKSPDRGLRL